MSKFDVSLLCLAIALFMFGGWFFYRNFKRNLWNKKTTLVSLWLILFLVFLAFVSVKSVKNSKYINDINPMTPMESSDCSKVFDFLHNLSIYLPNDLTIDNKKCYTIEAKWPDTTMSTQSTGDIAKVDLAAILKNNPYIKEHEEYKNTLNTENGKWYLGYVDKEISADITTVPLYKVRLFYGKKSDFNTNIFASELPDGKVKVLLTANIF